VLQDDHDFSVSSIHYLRVFVSAELCSNESGKAKLNEVGRELYGEWSSLPTRYEQLALDAFNVLPNFIHGILCIDLQRQKTLELEHPWSQNIRYTFADIVKGFLGAIRNKRGHRPIGLRSKYVFSQIADQPLLERFRTLIWEAPRRWDSIHKKIVGSDWPVLKEARVELDLAASCPYCNPVLRPRKNKVRYCGRHYVFVEVPADPSLPITYTPLADWLKTSKITRRA
jgi:hypothetical protein